VAHDRMGKALRKKKKTHGANLTRREKQMIVARDVKRRGAVQTRGEKLTAREIGKVGTAANRAAVRRERAAAKKKPFKGYRKPF